MTPLFKKLNYKDQPEIVLLNSPESFQNELENMKAVTNIPNTLEGLKEINFVMVFVTKLEEVNRYASDIYPLLKGDAIVWFAYPKGTSKKYRCDFNRDNGWTIMGNLGLEPVRMVAIDQDWSALRFRKAEFIKTMTRSFAMSEEGKNKVKKAQDKKS